MRNPGFDGGVELVGGSESLPGRERHTDGGVDRLLPRF